MRTKCDYLCTINRRVEQLVARWAHNPKVIGSSPIPASSYRKAPQKGAFFRYAISVFIPSRCLLLKIFRKVDKRFLTFVAQCSLIKPNYSFSTLNSSKQNIIT
jgi:hypothetical protein